MLTERMDNEVAEEELIKIYNQIMEELKRISKEEGISLSELKYQLSKWLEY